MARSCRLEKRKDLLMDANSFVPVRTFAETEVKWSPDSRYLLALKRHDFCGPYAFMLQAVDVQTGAATTIWNSRCKIKRSMTGWVSSQIKKGLADY